MVNRHTSATATAHLSGVRGRAVVNAKQHHLVVDSPLNLGGPNEAINPVDLLLSSLASHVAFVCERAALELGIPLDGLTVKVVGRFDPHGATEEAAQSHLQSVEAQIFLRGLDPAQVPLLLQAVEQRCLVYSTLARAVPVQLTPVLDGDAERSRAEAPRTDGRTNSSA